jgi:hypothetical protein
MRKDAEEMLRTPCSEYLRARHAERIRVIQRRYDEEEIDPVWRKSNPDSIQNFVTWFVSVQETKQKKSPQRSVHRTWYFFRIDENLPYGPDNCDVVNGIELAQRKQKHERTAILHSTVSEFLKANPEMNDVEVSRHFRPYSHTTIRKIILSLRKNAIKKPS